MNATLQDLLRVAADNKDRPFLLVPDRRLTLTFGEFHEAALGLACRLQEEGVKPGDRVCALLTNSPEYAILYFAALYMGAAVAAVNPSLHPRDVAFAVTHSGAKLLVYGEETKHFLLGAGALEVPFKKWLMPKLNEPLFRIPWQNHSWKPLDKVSADAILTIVFTSGTTAAPKAVAHTIGNLLGNAAAFNSAVALSPSDRFLHLLPMSYSGGFFNTLISPYLAGSSVVLTPGFGPRTALEFWNAPMEHGVNALWLTPAILSVLLKVDRDAAGKAWCRANIKKLFAGMGPLYPQVQKDFEAAYGVPVLNSFGLSETLIVSTHIPGANGPKESVGKLLPGVKAVAKDDELFVETPHQMAGYLDYVSGKLQPQPKPFPTGDMGTMDAQGWLTLTGRKKDLIIRSGLNISPLALEEVLLRHEAVAQAAVVGVPSELAGEDVVAVVKLKPGRDWAADKGALDAYCKASFAGASRPSALLKLDEFPAGPTGKVLKREIKEWAAAQCQKSST
jgi:long-chain acyl-CoA synthetase